MLLNLFTSLLISLLSGTELQSLVISVNESEASRQYTSVCLSESSIKVSCPWNETIYVKTIGYADDQMFSKSSKGGWFLYSSSIKHRARSLCRDRSTCTIPITRKFPDDTTLIQNVRSRLGPRAGCGGGMTQFTNFVFVSYQCTNNRRLCYVNGRDTNTSSRFLALNYTSVKVTCECKNASHHSQSMSCYGRVRTLRHNGNQSMSGEEKEASSLELCTDKYNVHPHLTAAKEKPEVSLRMVREDFAEEVYSIEWFVDSGDSTSMRPKTLLTATCKTKETDNSTIEYRVAPVTGSGCGLLSSPVGSLLALLVTLLEVMRSNPPCIISGI